MALGHCFILKGEVSSSGERATQGHQEAATWRSRGQGPADQSQDDCSAGFLYSTLSAPSFWPAGAWKAAWRPSHMAASQTHT